MGRNNDVLQFLKSIRTKRCELITLTDTRLSIQQMLMPAGIRYDIDRVQVSPADRMPDITADLVEIDNRLNRCIDKLTADIKLANLIIEQCPTAECRQLLLLRYISGDRKPYEWQEIAKQMGYSVSHVNGYLHGKAIREARVIWKKVNKP